MTNKEFAISQELYIEFDSRQLTVRTDVSEVTQHIRATFAHMLAERVQVDAGLIEIYRSGMGYSLRSQSTVQLPADELGYLLDLLKDEVRSHFIRSRPDLLWLHAGAVERGGTALLISGASGQGKSTLTTLLSEKGWRILSDDVSPVRMDADVVLPYPQAAVRRTYPGRAMASSIVQSLVREPVHFGPDKICRDATMVRGIVYIEFAEGALARVTRMPQGSAALEFLRNATNFLDLKTAAVEKAAAISRRLPAYRLSYCSVPEAVKALDCL